MPENQSPVVKRDVSSLSLLDKIRLVTAEDPERSWNALEMLEELRRREWVTEYVNVLDVADCAKEIYGRYWDKEKDGPG